MNVKQWALFFVVTLSANYVSSTFSRGGGHRRRSYAGWNTCSRRLHGFLGSNIDDIRHTVRSRYGGRCSLGDRELDNYSLKNVRGKGFGNFRLGDTCQYNVEGGQAFVRIVVSFEKIVTSFFLTIPEGIGGILGELSAAIFGIIGHFVNKFLHVVFPPFLCNVVMVGDHENGFKLLDFNFLKAAGDLDFDRDLAGHGDILGSFVHLLFEPLQITISLFLNNHIKPVWADEIGSWDYDQNLFAKLGLDLGGGSRGGGIGGGSYDEGIGGGSHRGGSYGGGLDDGDGGSYGGGADGRSGYSYSYQWDDEYGDGDSYYEEDEDYE